MLTPSQKSKKLIKSTKNRALELQYKKYEKIKTQLAYLPKKQSSDQTIVDVKNKTDVANYYKYTDKDLLLNKISTDDEITQYLVRLLKKSESEQLTNTQKFMLSNYIKLQIQKEYESSSFNLKKKFTKDELTVGILRKQWGILCRCWRLYEIKNELCRIGPPDIIKNKELKQKFAQLLSELRKIDEIRDRPNRLQNIWRMMKKFFQLMLQ